MQDNIVVAEIERINSDMALAVIPVEPFKDSLLNIAETSESHTLVYWLGNQDCLFDLNDNFYKFEISIAKSYFKKYQQDLLFLKNNQAICCNVQSKLLDILNCKMQGLQRSLYIEGLILNLVHYAMKSNSIEMPFCDSCVFLNKPIEVDKIQKSKEYILQNLHAQLTIPAIAAVVGTNQCYLKKGFKEIFGVTIFDFVLENRMVKAHHSLKNKTTKLADIADMVGYSSLSSFSQAFKKYYGINPSQVAEN
ncbi:MAG: AraC family transcriptional regulator [Bacteroidota bacterium]